MIDEKLIRTPCKSLNFGARYPTTFMRYRDDFRGAGRGPILAQSRFIAVKKRLQSVLRYRGFICDFIIFYTFQHAFQPPMNKKYFLEDVRKMEIESFG